MYDHITLSNGLNIVGERIAHSHSVSAGIWIGAGSRLESAAENGLSHFLEHMLFKGTVSRSARDIAWQADAMGAQMDAFTTKEYTCFYINAVSTKTRAALELLGDMLLNPRLDPGDMERERGVIIEEIGMNDDTPDEVAFDLLDRAVFGDHPLGRTILGPSENVRGFAREALINYRARTYVPENAVISIAGQYDPGEMRALLENIFGAWQPGKKPEAERVLSQRGETIRVDKDTEQTQICLGFPGEASGSAGEYAMSVFSNLLGGFMSSVLSQRVREEQGLAYSVYSTPTGYFDCGMLTIYAATAPGNAQRVVDSLWHEIDAMARGGFDEALFELARSQLAAQYVLGMEGQYARMEELGRDLLLEGKIQTADDVLQKIESVQYDEALAVMRRAFSARPAAVLYGRGVDKLALPE